MILVCEQNWQWPTTKWYGFLDGQEPSALCLWPYLYQPNCKQLKYTDSHPAKLFFGPHCSITSFIVLKKSATTMSYRPNHGLGSCSAICGVCSSPFSMKSYFPSWTGLIFCLNRIGRFGILLNCVAFISCNKSHTARCIIEQSNPFWPVQITSRIIWRYEMFLEPEGCILVLRQFEGLSLVWLPC